METRVLADGGECIRLIDYKTGRTPTVKQIFNDLQLVCYQLGLVFPEDGPRGAKHLPQYRISAKACYSMSGRMRHQPEATLRKVPSSRRCSLMAR